ncbi:MAG: hypothetical protein IKF72_07935 [Kiritimatiellae bacterium]|nr:hypothetical protein [Kiritimatiellia bacterium]
MTIKKPINESDAADASAAGAAGVPERFRLDIDPNAGRSSGGVATTVAMVAGLAALAVVGVLTFVIYQHWEFLKGA